ncbi:HPr(Ser) kinase/phosphatase [Methylomonas methanica]|uniref:HPr(Ser) kinase/phosphatase n=1 Tax=Methylomonas methanica (strain DSM 25384 / MC09) TaxID=857087 RepID=F9ZW54_METMM|nr:HPr(Ser) kinase/phosphatase [Methylomonas methanica]AEG02025.1 HPr(Ser) kinase/phosphatase [Methylomonas methanica MC09]
MSAHLLNLCGWQVCSDLPIADLLPWQGGGQEPDIFIRLGSVAERLEGIVEETPLFQVTADGTCRFIIEDVAVYLISGGRDVVIEPRIALDAPDLRVFLLGTVLGILCHQRNVLPIHGSCVAIDGKAVILAGNSGAGKSTLAAAFLRRGFPILADDVTVVVPDDKGIAWVRPAFPRLKVWSRTAEALGIDHAGFECSRSESAKVHLPLDDAYSADPLPLGAILHLNRAFERRFDAPERLRGIVALGALKRAVYRLPSARRLDPDLVRLKALLVPVAAACPTHWRLDHLHDFSVIDDVVSVIAANL